MCLLMGEVMAWPVVTCPSRTLVVLYQMLTIFACYVLTYVWDAVSIFNHLPRMFLSTDFAFRITDWISCHGPHIYMLLPFDDVIMRLRQLTVLMNLQIINEWNLKAPHSRSFVREIHGWAVDSPYKRPATWKAFRCHDAIMGWRN